MKAGAAIAFLLLATTACSTKPYAVRAAEQAEQRYKIVKASGSLREACAAATAVRDAWLAALEKGKYQLASVTANLECNAAQLYGADKSANIGTVRGAR
jgi:hypothetical protein